MGVGMNRGSNGNYTPPNPNPYKFNILRSSMFKNLTVVEVYYPGCTTFKGRKILVLKCVPNLNHIGDRLDPHFEENSNIVARFPATAKGWQHAQDFIEFVAR